MPVKRILMGQDPDKAASRDSLANPEALDYFAELDALVELTLQPRGEGQREVGQRAAPARTA